MRIAFSWVLGLLVVLYLALLATTTYVPFRYVDWVIGCANEHNLDPALVCAVIRCESRFRDDVVSSAGAIGLMQIMPETGTWIADQLDVPGFTVQDLFAPETNLRFGTWYLAYLMERFSTPREALWAYNAGPSHAEAWITGVESPYTVSTEYAERVARFVPIYRVALHAAWIYRVVPRLPL